MIPDFKNEAPTDFSDEKNQNAMLQAIKKAKNEYGREYELVIDGKKVKSDDKFASINPSNPDEIVGYAFSANREITERAIRAASKSFEEWKLVSPGIRARYLFKAAALMRKRKAELTAAIVLENGKNWVEADGDVAEAIDFLDYYAIRALQLAERQPLARIKGEDNELYYIPLGVGVVISPWNFPLAILTGMTVGPLVMGNSIVLKPASNTPVVAAKFMEIMEEAGVPDGVINLVYGSGSDIGHYLVSHPGIRFINFTGSREVGLYIVEEGNKIREGQKWIKRISAEMGGKNAIIIDSEAEVDSAVACVIASAFGYQGQKCSACSRAIIDEKIYDYTVQQLVEKTKAIRIGPAEDRENFMGPLIDQAALDKFLKYVEIGNSEGRILCGGSRLNKSGYYVEPTIFEGIEPRARLAQEEIFGPLLSLIKVKDFDQALDVANDTEYGLTGSVYSNNWSKLEKSRRDFHVGNLYFNRKSTSALVGVHPFGGYNMSGTGAKAGGNDYLLLFSQAKAVSEEL